MSIIVVLVDFQFCIEGKTLVLITPVADHCYVFSCSQTLFAILLVYIFYKFCICSLCLESFGASMMYFRNCFLGQVTGNLSRESDII